MRGYNENEDRCRGHFVAPCGDGNGMGEGCTGKGAEALLRLCNGWRLYSRAGLLYHDRVLEWACVFVSGGWEEVVTQRGIICRGCVGVMSGSCRGRVWVVSGSCLGRVWVVSGSCLGHVGVMSGSCLGRVWVVSGS